MTKVRGLLGVIIVGAAFVVLANVVHIGDYVKKKSEGVTFVVAWHIAVPTKVVYLEGPVSTPVRQSDFDSNDGERRYDRPYVPGWKYQLFVTYDGNDPESHWYSCEILHNGQLASGTQSYEKITNKPGTATCIFQG
jgi:hypothetical protein